MAKRKAVRKHTVKAELTVHGLSKAGSSMKLWLFAGGEKLGELEVGRGAVYWWGRNRRTAKRMSWSRFAAYMDEIAYR